MKMGKHKKDKVEKMAKKRIISYTEIFRYAKWFEVAATIVGIVCSIISSFGMVFNLITFGEMSTSFIERTSHPDQLSSRLPVLEWLGGGRRLINATYEENMKALMEDGYALLYGVLFSVSVSMLFCVAGVGLINWSALRQISRIRGLFLRSILRQDMSWYDIDTDFNLASRMSEDMLKIKEGMGEKLAVVGNLAGTALFCFCQAFPLGWELSLICMTVLPFSLVSSTLLTNYQSRSLKRELDSFSRAGKLAEEVLKSIRTVVAFGGETKEVERYRNLLEPAERYGRKRGFYTGLGTGFNWLLTYSLNAIGLAYGCRLVMASMDAAPTEDKLYNVGNMFTIIFSMYNGTQAITLCIPHGETFSSAKAAASSVFEIIELEPVIDTLSPQGMKPGRVIGNIEFKDVSFSYPSRPNTRILKNLSLSVKAGQSVALVGSSGCGKSTILQLIQRLYDTQNGVVKIDGIDVRSLNVNWLRSSLGVVGQEPVLFRGSIFDNIAIGDPSATIKEVQRVAEMAFAHEFIQKLPNGYDTLIGERGASLSGGQKQRIAIARALLSEPAILLLDEPTSALDPHSEIKVQAALDRAASGRTTLTVSHRLSTILNADHIICLDQGVIVEQGTHQELMNNKGFFYKLVTIGKDIKENDPIETVLEEDAIEHIEGERKLSRADSVRRSKKIHRVHSIQENQDWMAPRMSIGSVISTVSFGKKQSYSCETISQADQETQPLSDWQLMKLNGPEWLWLVIGSIAAVLQGGCFPVFSVLLANTLKIFSLVDREEVIYQASVYSVLFVIIAAVAGVSMCLQSATFTSAGLKMTTRLRLNYFSSLLNQEMGYFDKEANTVGALCSRLSGDAAEVQGATGLRTGLILQGVCSVGIGIIIALCNNWKLTLVATVFLPLMVGSIWFEGIISRKSQVRERKAMESATAIATEATVSIRTVQSLGVEQYFMTKFDECLKEGCTALARKTRWRGLVLGTGLYVPFLSFICSMVYGVHLVAFEGESYAIALLVPQAIMYGAYMLGQSLVYAPSLKSAKDCASRILGLVNRVPKIKTEGDLKDKNEWKSVGKVDLKDIEFCYPTRPHIKVLKGLNLSVTAGKTVALVGGSGCGKSTVLQMLQRFYDPVYGNIKLDDKDTRYDISLNTLRHQLGVVQQEPVLFDKTIAENIAYGDNTRQVSMQEIIDAAKSANIHDFISSLPKGYETRLGSGGAQLSGGQKQRVCIARALVRSPRLLLLDEATSALDANSEKAVSEALKNAAEGRTCITIAHRLSTIKDSELICVVSKGNIIESGTHNELIALKGYYYEMAKGQQMDSFG